MVNHRSSLRFTAAVLLLLVTGLAGQSTADHERRLGELERKVRQLDPSFRTTAVDPAARLQALEAKVEELLARQTVAASAAPAAIVPAQPLPQAAPQAPPVAAAQAAPSVDEPETRMPVAGYMEMHFNKDRGEPGILDFHRFVLLFGHSFSKRIKFWSELEVEHALVEGGEEKGELELEQAYLDFLIKPWINVRAGMLLTPMGIMNERHEPPSFNGVERPAVETVIIPSTWFDTGAGLVGDFGPGFRYRAYVMGGLDATAFSAEEGIRGGRQLGFETNFRNPAKVVRLEYLGKPRLALGTSFYSGHAGFNLRSVNPRVDIFNVDGRYSIRRFDFRGLFANVWISRAGELNNRLQRDFGFNPNIASQLRGWYLEPAIRVFPRRVRHDMAVFLRHERFNTQHQMPLGFQPLEQFNRSAWVVGATYKPNADVALKFDYIFNKNVSTVVKPRNSLNLGIGWWF